MLKTFAQLESNLIKTLGDSTHEIFTKERINGYLNEAQAYLNIKFELLKGGFYISKTGVLPTNFIKVLSAWNEKGAKLSIADNHLLSAVYGEKYNELTGTTAESLSVYTSNYITVPSLVQDVEPFNFSSNYGTVYIIENEAETVEYMTISPSGGINIISSENMAIAGDYGVIECCDNEFECDYGVLSYCLEVEDKGYTHYLRKPYTDVLECKDSDLVFLYALYLAYSDDTALYDSEKANFYFNFFNRKCGKKTEINTKKRERNKPKFF